MRLIDRLIIWLTERLVDAYNAVKRYNALTRRVQIFIAEFFTLTIPIHIEFENVLANSEIQTRIYPIKRLGATQSIVIKMYNVV